MKSSLRHAGTPGIDDAATAAARPGSAEDLGDALRDLGRPRWVVARDGGWLFSDAPPALRPGERAAFLPPMRPADLGDAAFRRAHGVRFACVAGAMANGIGSVEVVEAMARAGMLGFFGSAGLDPARVEDAADRLRRSLGDLPFGINFIHSPTEPDLEEALVDLFLRRGVRLAEASAFLDLTPALVRWRLTGLRVEPDGRVVAPNRVVAKVSRVEVAAKFLSPAPERIVAALAAAGRITAEEARLAAFVPMADDLTAEADSGGHTDNRPLVALLPTLIALRDRTAAKHRFAAAPRVGAAGGVATPASAAAAFSMGAAFVLTGSVNQCCLEAGTSDAVREMLAQAEQADTSMAPAADMFEMGVKVQVLKRGTMFPQRAQRLYDLWRAHGSIEELPAADRQSLEQTVFRRPLAEVWEETRAFFERRDPSQVEQAARDPRHRMALVFRWYLGMSSRWANSGEPTRRLDYQVWCGPAMGAFNEWARGSFLEDWRQRRVAVVAGNLLAGAAALLRAQAVRAQGVPVPPDAVRASPLPPDALEETLRG